MPSDHLHVAYEHYQHQLSGYCPAVYIRPNGVHKPYNGKLIEDLLTETLEELEKETILEELSNV